MSQFAGLFDEWSVGQVAERSGISVSALHFYEREGLIESTRSAGNQRRYQRETLRRLAFIRASQRVGIPLAAIKEALDGLPRRRTPREDDWAGLAAGWRDVLDDQIEQLVRLRDDLTDCIGCGCLSFQRCRLVNPADVMAAEGPGPRRLLPGTPRPEPGSGPASVPASGPEAAVEAAPESALESGTESAPGPMGRRTDRRSARPPRPSGSA
jgi:MerR family redox-sensitive transcriptional activator SoxR